VVITLHDAFYPDSGAYDQDEKEDYQD
jgi:hypothetical protein